MTLRPREAAEALGVSERTLRSLMRSGEIPFARLNRAVLIPVSGLEAFIASKMESGGGDIQRQHGLQLDRQEGEGGQ
jgi:excisionase family DNA binding protein